MEHFINNLIVVLLLLRSFSDLHSISWNFLGSQGLSLPVYIERIAVNDVTVYYYDSNMKSTTPCPKWLYTPAGQEHWKQTIFLSHHNRANMAEALQTTILQYNRSGINVYQGYSRCDLYPNGTIKSLLTHAFNGKDFLTFDIDNRRFIASVPEAHKYKSIRERNTILLETMVAFYEKTCFDHMTMFLTHSPNVNRTKAPEVKLFKRQRTGSTLITCHVTGFYPRAVQVKWIGAGLQLVDDELNDVLPNGDGTYQTRRSLIRPEGNPGNQQYSCVVYHSSIQGNITVSWVDEEKSVTLALCITLVCVVVICVLALVIRYILKRKDTRI